jgi:hypothetical protein
MPVCKSCERCKQSFSNKISFFLRDEPNWLVLCAAAPLVSHDEPCRPAPLVSHDEPCRPVRLCPCQDASQAVFLLPKLCARYVLARNSVPGFRAATTNERSHSLVLVCRSPVLLVLLLHPLCKAQFTHKGLDRHRVCKIRLLHQVITRPCRSLITSTSTSCWSR